MRGKVGGGLVVKKPPANAGDIRDLGSVPWLGKSSGGGNGNPLQYSCLENPMDRGAWRVTVHGVTKNWTPWKLPSTQAHTHWASALHQTSLGCFPTVSHLSTTIQRNFGNLTTLHR